MKVEQLSKEYATQMMGIGEYSENWNYADKYMFNVIVSSYSSGYLAAYTPPPYEPSDEHKRYLKGMQDSLD